MQRSIGKKILAMVAGVGMAGGMLAAGASTAQARDLDEVYIFQSYATPVTYLFPSGFEEGFTCGWGEGFTPQEASADAVEECKRREVVADDYFSYADGGRYENVGYPGLIVDLPELIQDSVDDTPPAPPACWTVEGGGNCPVGGALQTAVPSYMIAGVPQKVLVYASWRPDANSAPQPTGGTAVMQMNGDDIASAPFEDGVATFSFTPTVPGLKEVRVSGVVYSGLSGQSAYIDTVEVSTMVMPYDPELFEEALKNKKVEVGDTYTLEEVAQAKTALGKRLEWRVAQDSKDVCAVTTTKKGEVRAKFTESGKCSIIWTDPKKDEEGKYTFKVTA